MKEISRNYTSGENIDATKGVVGVAMRRVRLGEVDEEGRQQISLHLGDTLYRITDLQAQRVNGQTKSIGLKSTGLIIESVTCDSFGFPQHEGLLFHLPRERYLVTTDTKTQGVSSQTIRTLATELAVAGHIPNIEFEEALEMAKKREKQEIQKRRSPINPWSDWESSEAY